MIWFLSAAIAVTGVFFILHQIARANTKSLIAFFKQIGIALLALIIGIVGFRLVASGKGHFLWFGILGILPWLKQKILNFTMSYASTSFKDYLHRKQNPSHISIEEALIILEINAGADEKTIRNAWKKKIQQAHPDKGGSIEKAQRINQARDTLLRAYGK